MINIHSAVDSSLVYRDDLIVLYSSPHKSHFIKHMYTQMKLLQSYLYNFRHTSRCNRVRFAIFPHLWTNSVSSE